MPRRLLQVLLAAAVAALLARRAPERRPPMRLADDTNGSTGKAVTYAELRHLVVATVSLVLALWLLLWLASRASEVLTLFVISGVLSVALRPTVDRLSGESIPLLKRKIPRAMAILLIYLGLLLFIVGILLVVIPQLVQEFQRFLLRAPDYVARIEEMLAGLRQYPFIPEVGALEGQLLTQLAGGVSQAMGVLLFAVDVATTLLSAGVILVLTFFLLMEAEALHNHVISLLPVAEQDRARRMSARMGAKIAGWLRGIVLLSVFIGVSTSIAMWALGMPYPLLLGLAAGIFEFLPMVGAYLGAAPAVLLALFQPTWVLVAVIVYFVVIQQIENNILAPTIMEHEVEMPPLLVIVALLLGAGLMGIVGALLAVPVGAVAQVVWNDLVVPEIRRRQRSGESGA
jgi:predicted PurR-regulated permease PerM